jgi:hypothetical protein
MRSLTVLFLVFSSFLSSNSKAETIADDTILVKRTTDFEVTGNGDSHEWKKALWNSIPQRRDTLNKRETKVKTLYSQKGIYFLFNNQDEVLTASKKEDFDSLWLEDVNEVFLWPDTTNTIYFEYEISPFNNELPLLVPHLNGTFIGWRPWTYTKRKEDKAYDEYCWRQEDGCQDKLMDIGIFYTLRTTCSITKCAGKTGRDLESKHLQGRL